MNSMTGKWKGFFTQILGTSEEPYEAKFDFEMDLIQNEDGFEGTCKDMEIEIGQNEKSKIKGFIDNQIISFTKQYDNSIFYDDQKDELILIREIKQDEINYYGTWDQSTNKFHGKWEILMSDEPTLDLNEYKQDIEYGDWEMEKVSD
jgi:hypothetical protein